MCHLLLHHQRGQAASEQALQYLQESIPFELLVQVVQDEQRIHVSAVQESFQLWLRPPSWAFEAQRVIGYVDVIYLQYRTYLR